MKNNTPEMKKKEGGEEVWESTKNIKISAFIQELKETFQDKINLIILASAIALWGWTLWGLVYYKNHYMEKPKWLQSQSRIQTATISPLKEETPPSKETDAKTEKENMVESSNSFGEEENVVQKPETNISENPSYNRMKNEVLTTWQISVWTSQEDVKNLWKIIEMMNEQEGYKKRK